MSFGLLMGYLTIFSTLLPLAALVYRPSPDRNRLRVAALGVLWFIWEVINYVVIRIGFRNNLWVGYLFGPAVALLVLLILYHWQIDSRGRLAIRLIAPAYLLATIVLTQLLEQTNRFSIATGPLTGALLLVLVLYTLISRSLLDREALGRSDWFWVCMGLALSFGLDTFIQPALRYMVGASQEGSLAINLVNTLVGLTSMFLISRGLLCPEHLAEPQ